MTPEKAMLILSAMETSKRYQCDDEKADELMEIIKLIDNSKCDPNNCTHLDELGRLAYLSEQRETQSLRDENEKLKEALRWYTSAQEWAGDNN